KRRKYETKESYKWQRSSEEMNNRFSGVMEKIITVCDRESDIFEYIDYKTTHNQRFVVRAKHERAVNAKGEKLTPYIESQSSIVSYSVHIHQKGGRKARVAKVAVRFASITLYPPKKHKKLGGKSLFVISCNEINPPNGTSPLSWKLYTSEPVNNAYDALSIVRFYELRWRVEEFHKAWKSAGTQVESFRMQTRNNLEKIIVITAFIAVRLLQLRELIGDRDKAKSTSCEQYFSALEWKILWAKAENKKVPTRPPSLHWAYYALAKLGGWYDSKRTGIVGWDSLYKGWFSLTQMLDGAVFMQSQLNEM
ncbi:IS4 family transposase, partial [Agaribacter flavus]